MANVVSAPYATIAIPVYLSSVTGLRYRSLNCVECGQEFLERNNQFMYRSNDASQPNEVAITGESVLAVCGNCSQQYRVSVSLTVTFEQDGIPLYLQPESVYLAVEAQKRLRYVHCLECGHAYQSISDRVSQIVDNRVPFEYVSALRFGPIERTCTFNKCGQTWSIMV